MNIVSRDVAIIGAGPVGLFCAFTLGQVGLRAAVVDALPEVGGQCTALYPDKPIYDIPAQRSITAAALIDDLLKQAKPYGPEYLLGRRVVACADCVGGFELGLSDGLRVRAGAVVIAAGAGAFTPNRPPVERIEGYEGTSVFYAVRDPWHFRDRHVVITGGGDSAADWGVFLADIAASVTIVHRRASFRAAPATVERLQRLSRSGRIRIVAPGGLAGLEGEGAQISSVHVDDGTGVTKRLPADALLCFFGLAKDLSDMAGWGLGADRHGIPVEPSTMSAIRPGIFAVGDIARYPGKLKLILTGFAEAALAAHQARAFLKPDEAFSFTHSTSRGEPRSADCAAE